MLIFTAILGWLSRVATALATTRGVQSDLERYVAQRNPSNAAEVDHLVRQFDREQQEHSWI